MKSVLRIYLNPNAIDGLAALINQAATVAASEHEVLAMSVRLLLQKHEVLRRFSDEELKMGNLTYRCPVWIENDDVGFEILFEGLGLDRRIASATELIDYFSVRHYFSVPSWKTVELGRVNDTVRSVLNCDGAAEGWVNWIVSYDPTRDNPFRYRLDIECKSLKGLSDVALKIVACEKIA